MLTEFREYSASRFRVKESDIQALSAFARCLVNYANTLFITFSQCICHAVLNAECYVVNTMVTFVEPFLDCAVRRCRFQEFQLHLTALQESSLNLLVSHFFDVITLQSQYIFEVSGRFFNTLNSYSKMFDVRNRHIDIILFRINTLNRLRRTYIRYGRELRM